ncbi:hypothetical protein FC99_GL000146 [Levilactobacillus koreensis JCM 16448]|uniref:Uncharacterized protein n=1 Tax=Levilactobacillus koreensis TaxID=637971 RepID=A0AAC8UU44_9LACO|nr:hypothetical protein [Levilactobacillus koreensis]AKP64430.1 hypothetical protein ABN16_05065 [Levilactobacillus koreensis]KRK90252.1 hypothetical protein FC99_GL000146 [Levilactobacillus koreensis JCM 16448]
MNKKLLLTTSIALISFTLIPTESTEAKMRYHTYENITVYKFRRGDSIHHDLFLKSFTLKSGSWLNQAKYINKEGGWELSSNYFESGKYNYYLTLSNRWDRENDKVVEITGRMPTLPWVNTKSSSPWLTTKPGDGKKILNISKSPHTIWTTKRRAVLKYGYGTKPEYYYVTSKRGSGWINKYALKLAPHKLLSVQVPANKQKVIIFNADGSKNYMWPNNNYTALKFPNSSKIWINLSDNRLEYNWADQNEVLINN